MLLAFPRPRISVGRFTQVALVMFVSCSVFFGFRHLAAQTSFGSDILASFDLSSSSKDGNATLLALAPSYINAIMNPNDESFSQAECPKLKAG
ncbi:uncharacterized protein LY89DRAFT_718461, partial [Mollisia scopiformis]